MKTRFPNNHARSDLLRRVCAFVVGVVRQSILILALVCGAGCATRGAFSPVDNSTIPTGTRVNVDFESDDPRDNDIAIGTLRESSASGIVILDERTNGPLNIPRDRIRKIARADGRPAKPGTGPDRAASPVVRKRFHIMASSESVTSSACSSSFDAVASGRTWHVAFRVVDLAGSATSACTSLTKTTTDETHDVLTVEVYVRQNTDESDVFLALGTTSAPSAPDLETVIAQAGTTLNANASAAISPVP